MSDEIVNDVDVQESAGSTGLLDDVQDVAVQNDVQMDAAPDADFSRDEQPSAATAQIDAKSFDPLFHDIDDDDLKTDAFDASSTEHDIKDLTTVARRMRHNFRVAYKMKQGELDRSHESRVAGYKKREQQIQHLERDFARRQAEWASLIEDPAIQNALNVGDEELPDIMSEDGINAHINRRVAEAVSSVFQPMQEASQQRRQESAFYDFLDAHPEMKDPA